MIRIIYIRQAPQGGCDGTDTYCQSLFKFFHEDKDCMAERIINYPEIKSHFFHYYYKQKALTAAIMEADIIHINGYTAMGTVQALITSKILHKTVVYTAHWHPFNRLSHPFLGKFFFNIFLRNTIKFCATTVTTINNEDYAFFKSFHKNVVQIPHWYKPENIKINIKKKKNMILFVGRADDPVKGIEHIYSLPEGMFEIHCVGKGHIKQRSDITQHINIPTEKLISLYLQASVVVVPSKYEAFSYVTLESLCYGTPVVMSENVRIADHLNYVNGYSIFKYGDYPDFLKKINETIGQDVDTTKIIKIFDPEKIRLKYKELYLSSYSKQTL